MSQVNRATSETLRLQATQEGLVPLKGWIKRALDHVIQVGMNEPGLEFVWVGDDGVDPLQQAQTLEILGAAGGVKSQQAMQGSWIIPPTPAIPGERTKREHFLDCLRGLPSRADIHDLELRLGERLDSLAARFDRTFDAHLS